MKILVGGIVGLLGSFVLVLLDVKLIKWMFTLLPASDWSGLIKVIIVFFDIWFVLGLCILPFIVGLAIGTLLDDLK